MAKEGSFVKGNGCIGTDRGSLNVPVKNVSREDGKCSQMIVPYFENPVARSRKEKMDIEFNYISVDGPYSPLSENLDTSLGGNLGKRKFLTYFDGGQSNEKQSKEETWAKRNTFSTDNDVEILKYPNDSLAFIISKFQAISPTTLVKFEKAVLGGIAASFEAGKQRDNEKGHLGNSKKN
ncbi:hypothetical protein QYF36_019861 [Acer negundo]|nr:hypothetical protein QYF36_018193 [Acer negundo]KAK4840857.1 hypothetical protein QYF36_019861 [Acer negundo]